MKITEESMKPKDSTAAEGSGNSKPAPSEKEKLRDMPPKDRLWYIWSYYKFPIIGAVIAVILLVNVAGAIYRGTFDTALHLVYINSQAGEELDTVPLEEGFAQYAGLGKKDEVISEVSYISFGDTANDYSYASMAKITALVAAKDLDAIIGDEEAIGHYASLEAYLDLEADLPPDLLAMVKDRLYYAAGEDGKEAACAIDISGTAFAEQSHLGQKPLLGIISNSKRKDMAELLIRYIFAADAAADAAPGTAPDTALPTGGSGSAG